MAPCNPSDRSQKLVLLPSGQLQLAGSSTCLQSTSANFTAQLTTGPAGDYFLVVDAGDGWGAQPWGAAVEVTVAGLPCISYVGLSNMPSSIT